MAVTINASTSTGLVQSADTSGQIELQTNGTTVATVNTSNNVQFRSAISVGNATPTTSGAGITFPATQSASSDANTLDDYEEGTWTPTLNANLTASSNYTTGQYIKIGKLCYINYSFAVGSVSGSNAITISLPFTSASNFTNGRADQGWAIYTSGVDTGDIGTLAYIGGGATNIEVYGINDNASGVQLTNANLAVNDFIFFNICYQTA